MVGLCGVTSYALRHTTWGRHIYAVGDDADSARLVGIRTTRVLLSAYFVAGIIYALAAWILIGRVGIASPTNAVNANLDSITAAVIGGTSLFGGRGSVVGTLVGALIVGVYQSGIALANVQSLYQNLVEGILIIAAVALDQWIRQVRR
jgi:fructose transport system permease protein